MAVPAEQHCRLMYSPPICIVVALAILVKVVSMFFAGRITRYQSAPLLTFGDAVASFTKNPDSTTAGMCWISCADINRGEWKRVRPPGLTKTEEAIEDSKDSWKSAAIYKPLPPRKRWMEAPGIKRNSITITW